MTYLYSSGTIERFLEGKAERNHPEKTASGNVFIAKGQILERNAILFHKTRLLAKGCTFLYLF